MEYEFALTLSPDAKVGSDFANDLLKQFEISQESSLFSTNHEDSEEEDELEQQIIKEIKNENHFIQKEMNTNLDTNHIIKETMNSSSTSPLTSTTTNTTTSITQQVMNDTIMNDDDDTPLKEMNKINNEVNENNDDDNDGNKMEIDNDMKDVSIKKSIIENENPIKNKNDNNIQEEINNHQVTPFVEPLTKTITVQEQTNNNTINIYNNNELNYDLDNNSSINTNSRIHDSKNNNNTFPRRAKTLKANSTAPKKRSLLRRSSAYLRQKFFSSATSPTSNTTSPPLPTSKPNSQLDTTTIPIITTTTTTSPTEINTPSNNLPIDNKINSNNDHEHDNNINQSEESTTTATNDSLPTIPPMVTPSQYPPKPLTYSTVVDPPNDHHRGSFPILQSWRISMLDPRRKSEPVVQAKKRRSIF